MFGSVCLKLNSFCEKDIVLPHTDLNIIFYISILDTQDQIPVHTPQIEADLVHPYHQDLSVHKHQLLHRMCQRTADDLNNYK